MALKNVKRLLNNILVSSRPTTWIRILSEMILGLIFTQNIYNRTILTFLLGFICVGPFFTSGAYILNDITDKAYDVGHILRRKRPIASGVFSDFLAIRVSVGFIFLSFLIGSFLGCRFVTGLFILLVSQLLYTVKPFRLKEKFPFDMILNGINSGARFMLGYLLGNNSLINLPVFFLLFAVTIKLILFLGHRIQSRDIEIKNRFKSMVAIFSVHKLKMIIFWLLIIAVFLYFFSIYYYHFKVIVFILPIIFFFILIPLLKTIHDGYLLKQEENIFWRVYLYIIFLLFSLSLLVLSRQ
jgi:4-hydroxybenzoate polyprenyltransferase